jgi:hypothetical protein
MVFNSDSFSQNAMSWFSFPVSVTEKVFNIRIQWHILVTATVKDHADNSIKVVTEGHAIAVKCERSGICK